MIRPRRLLAAGVVLSTLVALSACSSTVALKPAPSANDPLCAEVMVALPDVIAGHQQRHTDAQATSAWGDPAVTILTCGVTPPGPTTLPCNTVDGVDWIIDDADAPNYRFTTYGRTPAVEVYLTNTSIGSVDVLPAVAAAVKKLPTDAACTDLADTERVPDANG